MDSEEREYQILKCIDKYPQGIGFNKLQKETQIPRKTLHKYLQSMEKEQTISIEKLGDNSNSDVRIITNISPRKKENLKVNFEKMYSQYYWGDYKQKFRKLNTFPHFLQFLSAQYYEYLVEYFFQSSASYKFGLKQIEEKLEKEKEKLEELNFTRSDYENLVDDCDSLSFTLLSDSTHSISDTARRKHRRTWDEIEIDITYPKHIFPNLETDYSIDNWSNFRFQNIKDPKKKKEFIKLMDEHNQVITELSRIKEQMTRLAETYPDDKVKTKKI